MRLVFMGTGSFGVPALAALCEAGHEIEVAISQPDRPARRGLKVEPTPIHAAAIAREIRHIQTEDVNAPESKGLVKGADAAVVVSFGQKLGEAILSAPRLGCINIHASLLPKYRGAAPYQWAILNGDAATGVTTFRINSRWDAGDVWLQRETPIGETETADELHDRLSLIGAELIVETLRLVERGVARPTPQSSGIASRAPKLSRADGYVDWTQGAYLVVRRIHGLWSWPGATCVFRSRSGREERVLLARGCIAEPESAPLVEPGVVREDGAIQCGSGSVRLLEVKPAGGKLMAYEAFLNGRHVGAGDRWERVRPE